MRMNTFLSGWRMGKWGGVTLLIGGLLLASAVSVWAAAPFPPTDTIVIDGVFTGDLLDSDGTLSHGVGDAGTVARGFIELKPFDDADRLCYQDSNQTERLDAGDALWLDGNANDRFDSLDKILLGNPLPYPATGTLISALHGATTIAYNDAEITLNNAYDDGEDIYLIASSEFQGATQRIVYDPRYPGERRVVAHLYVTQDEHTIFVHNDFIVDAAATWIDGDGTEAIGGGIPTVIGFPVFANAVSPTLTVDLPGRWFTMQDNLYWFAFDPLLATWTPSRDALWRDRDGDGIYSETVDSLIYDGAEFSTEDGGLLVSSDGLQPIYNLVYNDANNNNIWDDGEDISTLAGDTIYDWAYFLDRWAWLVDGDGDLTPGAGTETAAGASAAAWFQAGDRAFHYDADGDAEWDAGDALWLDGDGDGLYTAALDRMLVLSGTVADGVAGRLLWVQLVDGDGYTTDLPGSEYLPRRGQTPFSLEDNVLWYDAPGAGQRFWSAGDGLWLDVDHNDIFDPMEDWVLVRGEMPGGARGVRLSPGALHFGYDDGEVALNGRYDPGEDIYAANTFLAYDDFEIAFNGQYDPGEDIRNRAYVEIWVYAEGDSAMAPVGMPNPSPEPAARDVGFRVHINGVRVDNPAADYDAPYGFQAAAGWGPSRGAVGAGVPAGGYNRHYEYKLTPGALGTPGSLAAEGVTWTAQWQVLRRQAGGAPAQSFAGPPVQSLETVWAGRQEVRALPPETAPLVIQEAIMGPLPLAPDALQVDAPYCWNLFAANPGAQPVGRLVLTETLPPGWAGSVVAVTSEPPTLEVTVAAFPVITLPTGLPAQSWVQITLCATGPLDPAATEIVAGVEGVVDADVNPDTPPTPLPTAASYRTARAPIVREPSLTLAKAATPAAVYADKSAIWRIGVANTGLTALHHAWFQDTPAAGLLPRTVMSRALGTLWPDQVHFINLEADVATTILPETILTNTVTLFGDFVGSETGWTPYHSAPATATVLIRAPRAKMPPGPYTGLPVAEGPPITNFMLQALLDQYAATAHSRLFVLTQFYGNDLWADLIARPQTAALAATAPDRKPVYAGYDQDAALALFPAADRTSAAVHQAGVAGQDTRETPQQGGVAISLAPTAAAGPIQRRQVLIYAGLPDVRGPWESAQRDIIRANFTGASDTPVAAIGGGGGNGWDRPATLAELRAALSAAQLTANSQLILFVTGPGEQHALARDVEIPPRARAGVAIPLSAALAAQMRQTTSNEPGTGVTLYYPGVSTLSPGDVAVYLPDVTTVYTDFVAYPVDLNGDVNLDAPGEGTYLVFAIPEADLLRAVGVNGGFLRPEVENLLLEPLYFGYVSVDSGPLHKGLPYAIYLPLTLREH